MTGEKAKSIKENYNVVTNGHRKTTWKHFPKMRISQNVCYGISLSLSHTHTHTHTLDTFTTSP